MTEPDLGSPDATYLLGVVEDNEDRTTHGMTEAELSVCFEMSALCGYGFARLEPGERPFTRARFRAALRELARSTMVTKRGNRWYRQGSPGLRGADDEAGVRPCARKGCRSVLTRPNALYCSKRCRDRDYRYGAKTERVPPEIERDKPCSGHPQTGSFSGVGQVGTASAVMGQNARSKSWSAFWPDEPGATATATKGRS
jgi:hypothetical protein